MEEKSFRILLDFTEINVGEAELKYVWMYVSPRELKTIFDFKRAILKKFSFTQENFKLFVRDGLLLDNEKIGILREDDTVKLLGAQYPNQSFVDYNVGSYDQAAVSFQKDEQTSCESQGSPKKHKKRKSDAFTDLAEEDNLSLKYQIKKKRCDKSPHKSDSVKLNNFEKKSLNNQSEVVVNIMKSPNEKCSKQSSQSDIIMNNNKINDKELKKNSYSNKKLKSKTFNTNVSHCNDDNTYQINEPSPSNFYTTAEIPSEITISAEIPTEINMSTEIPTEINMSGEISTENNCKKRKRKRKRKRKETSKTETSLLENSPELNSSFLSDAANTIKSHDNSLDIRKHVIYHSPTPPLKSIDTVYLDPSTSDSYCAEECVEKIPLSNTQKNPAKLSALDSCVAKFIQQENNLESEYKNNSILSKTGLSPKISTPISKNALKEQSWSVTPLQKVDVITSDTFSVNDRNRNCKNIEKLPYEDCTPLTYLPPVGTRLVYKTLELNENYSPEVTQYKEGVVKKIDQDTDELEIELIQEERRPGRIGKFENLYEDEIPLPQIIKRVSINWTALIDPRLIS